MGAVPVINLAKPRKYNYLYFHSKKANNRLKYLVAIPAVAAKGSVTTTMKKTSVMTVIRFWEGSSSLAIRKENTISAVGRPKVSKLKCLIYQSTILSGILTTVLKTEKNLWTCRYRLTDPSSAAILPSNKPTKSLILTLLIIRVTITYEFQQEEITLPKNLFSTLHS